MDDIFQVKSSDSDAQLVLRRVDENTYSAELTSASLSMTTRVYQFGGGDRLNEFWRDLARDWRGWDGVRTWEPLEGCLYLSAVSDRLGHVTVTVRLEDRVPFRFAAEAQLLVEAGQLDRIASEAQRFCRAFGAAA